MKARTLATGGLLSLLMAAGTWIVGWWVVPMIAAAWGLFFRPVRPWLAGLAGSLAWGILLASAPWDALQRLAPRLGGIFHLPGWGMVVLTLGFVWLLGWSSARVGTALISAATSAPAPENRAGTG